MKDVVEDIEDLTVEVAAFRRVAYTGKHLQRARMALKVANDGAANLPPITDRRPLPESSATNLVLPSQEFANARFTKAGGALPVAPRLRRRWVGDDAGKLTVALRFADQAEAQAVLSVGCG